MYRSDTCYANAVSDRRQTVLLHRMFIILGINDEGFILILHRDIRLHSWQEFTCPVCDIPIDLGSRSLRTDNMSSIFVRYFQIPFRKNAKYKKNLLQLFIISLLMEESWRTAYYKKYNRAICLHAHYLCV
jgi:hypothetical protein